MTQSATKCNVTKAHMQIM